MPGCSLQYQTLRLQNQRISSSHQELPASGLPVPMLQTTAPPYMPPALRDRSPPLHLMTSVSDPLQSVNTFGISTAAAAAAVAAASMAGGATGLLTDDHHLHQKHHQQKPQLPRSLESATTSTTPESSPGSHLYGHNGSVKHPTVPSNGRVSPVASTVVGGPVGLYHPSAGPAGFGGDAVHHHHHRLMAGAPPPSAYHHHHPHVAAHGYLPFGANATPIDPGLFYPSAAVAAALQHVEAADTWRSALTQSTASLWPYNAAANMGLYPCVGPAYVGIDSRRKNATRESTSTLKAWLYEHIKNPYPTKGEKIMLAIITKMTLTQVSTWFANARRRLKKENKMQWSTDGKPDDDDDDNNDDDDDDVIDVSNDIDEFKDDDDHQSSTPPPPQQQQLQKQQQMKAAVEDGCRVDCQLSPVKHMPAFDIVQKNIGLSGADYTSSSLYGVVSQCYSVNGCNPPTFHCDSRASAFHFPPPPPTLLSLMPPPPLQASSPRNDHSMPDYGSSNTVDRRSFYQSITAVENVVNGSHSAAELDNTRADFHSTSGRGELRSPKFDGKQSNVGRDVPDVVKPRPRIWSLADVAMSTSTTRRCTGDDDVTAATRQTPPASVAGYRNEASCGTGASVTSNAFQPWARERSPPTRAGSSLWNVDRQMASPTQPMISRIKTETSNRSASDAEDSRRLSNSATDGAGADATQKTDERRQQ